DEGDVRVVEGECGSPEEVDGETDADAVSAASCSGLSALPASSTWQSGVTRSSAASAMTGMAILCGFRVKHLCAPSPERAWKITNRAAEELLRLRVPRGQTT